MAMHRSPSCLMAAVTAAAVLMELMRQVRSEAWRLILGCFLQWRVRVTRPEKGGIHVIMEDIW